MNILSIFCIALFLMRFVRSIPIITTTSNGTTSTMSSTDFTSTETYSTRTRAPSTEPTMEPTMEPIGFIPYSPNGTVLADLSTLDDTEDPPLDLCDGSYTYKALTTWMKTVTCITSQEDDSLVNADGDDAENVLLKYTIDPTRWVGVGFVDGDLDESYAGAPMNGAYALIINQDNTVSEVILHRADASSFSYTPLTSTVTVLSDSIVNNNRDIVLLRKSTITTSDLGDNMYNSSADDYYDFIDFADCEDTMSIIYAMGENEYDWIPSYHGSVNRAHTTMEVEYSGTTDCSADTPGEGDNANTISILSVFIISIIAVLTY